MSEQLTITLTKTTDSDFRDKLEMFFIGLESSSEDTKTFLEQDKMFYLRLGQEMSTYKLIRPKRPDK